MSKNFAKWLKKGIKETDRFTLFLWGLIVGMSIAFIGVNAML